MSLSLTIVTIIRINNIVENKTKQLTVCPIDEPNPCDFLGWVQFDKKFSRCKDASGVLTIHQCSDLWSSIICMDTDDKVHVLWGEIFVYLSLTLYLNSLGSVFSFMYFRAKQKNSITQSSLVTISFSIKIYGGLVSLLVNIYDIFNLVCSIIFTIT